MSDQPNNKPGFLGLTDEQRLLLAIVLMFGVWMAWSFVMPKPPEPVAQQKKEAAAKGPSPATSPTPAPAAATAQKKPPTKSEPAVEELAAEEEERFTIKTNLYEVRFNNRGAVVESWILTKFKQNEGKPLDLVNPVSLGHAELYPFTITYRDQQFPPIDLRQALYSAKVHSDGLGIDFEFSQKGVISKKSFQFTKSNYLTDVTSVVTVNGASIPHLLSWRGGFGDSTVPKSHAAQHTTHIAPADNSPTEYDNSHGKSGPQLEGGNWTFAGIEDNFFAAIFLPKSGTYLELQTWSDKLPIDIKSKEEELFVGGAVGTSGPVNQFSLFVGPKDTDILAKVNPKLDTVVDWGWFGFLAKPLFAFLKWMDSNYVHSWGWSIILATVIINILMIPIKMSSMKNMKQMAVLQPEIAKINEKYAGVKLNDSKNNDKNEEIMSLYKKHGVNPAGGCVPMLLPFPFLFAFYKVLSLAIDLRGASWLWVADLSQPESIAIRILPILMIASQFYMQHLTPNTTGDPTQQRMMKFMPLMFGFIFYNASSGLVLYWLTSNVMGIAQQLYTNKTGSTIPPASAKTIDVRKKGPKK